MQREDLCPLSVGQCATLACLLEATAPKPGNVHRGADFEDLRFVDFLTSAVLIGPVMERVRETGVGQAIADAVAATRRLVSTNTNLGAVLLIAPLAAVPRAQPLDQGINAVLAGLDASDAAAIYRAIRTAQPGGMGQVERMDVAGPAPTSILDAMRAAADRDVVARQYACGFDTVLNDVVPKLTNGRSRGWTLTETIVHTHVTLMSRHPDSLIARKCGTDVAQQSAERAFRVLEAGEPGSPLYLDALSDLDFWLRSDHHRRNPGTTADLIAAGLFAALRDGCIPGPYH